MAMSSQARKFWVRAGEPSLGQKPEDVPALSLAGPVPKVLALQLASSLPSAQLVIPSHTKSCVRQRSRSQRNSLWAQLPGEGHEPSGVRIPQSCHPLCCIGSS